MIKSFIVVLFGALQCFPAIAEKLSFEGNFIQGGLVIGKTNPGTKITLDGRQVRVTEDGMFIFGFGRDAGMTAILRVVFPDGKRRVQPLTVTTRKYRISRINGLPPEMVTPSSTALLRIKAEGRAISAARAIFTPVAKFGGGFIWPTKGRISGVYGSQRILNGKPRRPHLGIDIAAPIGHPVVAAAAGTVTLANTDVYFTGGTVIINHGHGLSSVYSHLSAIHARLGQDVKQGEIIGKIGSTGRSTGPHLDWRINWFQERLDPQLLLGPMPK